MTQHPDRARLRSAIVHRRRRGPRGEGSPRPSRSDGYEFAELRAYVAGDDIRRIDWAATARAGGLQTRVLFEDHSLVLGAVIDASGSMQVGRQRSLYEAACDAAGLWYSAADPDDRCGRFGDGTGVYAGRGRASAALCMAEGALDARAGLAGALRTALHRLPRDASLLVISDFFDMSDELSGGLRACAARFDVTALLARDPWSTGLPLRGFVRLRDAETGEALRGFIGPRTARRIKDLSAVREREVTARLEALGVRAGILDEEGGPAGLLRAFGLPA